jgi:predicted acylesterase/phospholipase RssA
MSSYLDALARHVIGLKDAPPDTPGQPELIKTLKANDLSVYPDANGLAEALEGMPEVQPELARLTDYSPSAWLVEQEIEQIELRRRAFNIESIKNAPADHPFDRAHDSQLIGLCCSGGGIRSATFNLGVLQGLAELNLLRHVDYLSSVSGGGYIHQWFAAWLRRLSRDRDFPDAMDQPRDAFEKVAAGLLPRHTAQSDREPDQLLWLRRYSNYLTPKRGGFTADGWSAVATWLRNTLLNQAALITGLLFALLLPHLLMPPEAAFTRIEAPPTPAIIGAIVLATIVNMLLLVAVAGVIASANLSRRFTKASSKHLLDDFGVQAYLVVPLLAWALLVVLLQDDAVVGDNALATWVFVLVGTVVGTILGGILAFRSEVLHAFKTMSEDAPDAKPTWLILARRAAAAVGTVLAAAAGSLVGSAFTIFVPPLAADAIATALTWNVDRVRLIFGPPLVLFGLMLGVITLVGLLGRLFNDSRREWLSRLTAWGGMYSAIWIVYVGISLSASAMVAFLIRHAASAGIPSLVSWIGMTTAGVLAGRSGQTTGSTSSPSRISIPKEWLAAVGPYVFVLGLLILVGWAAEYGFEVASPRGLSGLGLLFGTVAAVGLVFGWRVDVNEFSMHAFYRNRLARGYLGASNQARHPNPFIGMDAEDASVPMCSLLASRGYPGPFPIFCAALNLSDGDELAWQERKAASFVFTPLYTGYDTPWSARAAARGNMRFSAFVDTAKFAYRPQGISIATVAAISGAAVSPNWGYHTNPVTAFLLTIFNARLGWWLLNPRAVAEDGLTGPRSSTKRQRPAATPTVAISELIRELLGKTGDTSRYVYLSDGGHFDNMGLYELVRRRCRFIIVSDAEQDEDGRFEGIASAIRRCRTDFGVEIDLDLRMLDEADPNTGHTKRHTVVGKIRYPKINKDGYIVYMKSSLTGDEPADVLGYRKTHDAFPHDTTANQWFTESQFESYRRLGLHVVRSTFEPATVGGDYGSYAAREELFKALRDIWFPPTPEMERFQTVHSDRYGQLIRRVREDSHLTGLLDKLYTPGNGKWSASGPSPADVAYAVAFTSELIEFMETVYLDLNLVYPPNARHPHAQGWIEVFKKCATVDVIRDGWLKFGPSYSPGFQRFATDSVGLPRL